MHYTTSSMRRRIHSCQIRQIRLLVLSLLVAVIGSGITITLGLLSVRAPWLCESDGEGGYPWGPLFAVLPPPLQDPVLHPAVFTVLPLMTFPCMPMLFLMTRNVSCGTSANAAVLGGLAGGTGRLAALIGAQCTLTHAGVFLFASGAAAELVGYSCAIGLGVCARARQQRLDRLTAEQTWTA